MAGTTYGRDEKCIKHMKGRDYLRDLGVDGKIILIQILKE
jgi:hypothetical protein